METSSKTKHRLDSSTTYWRQEPGLAPDWRRLRRRVGERERVRGESGRDWRRMLYFIHFILFARLQSKQILALVGLVLVEKVVAATLEVSFWKSPSPPPRARLRIYIYVKIEWNSIFFIVPEFPTRPRKSRPKNSRTSNMEQPQSEPTFWIVSIGLNLCQLSPALCFVATKFLLAS